MHTKDLKGASVLERGFALRWESMNGIGFVREYRFHPEREWRFDFAWPVARCAIEIHGGLGWNTVKRGKNRGKRYLGGHNTRKGVSRDCEKITEAALLGWRVFVLTKEMSEDRSLLRRIGASIAERLCRHD